MEVDIDGTVIGTLYRRLDVFVLYPREEPLGNQDIIDLKDQGVQRHERTTTEWKCQHTRVP